MTTLRGTARPGAAAARPCSLVWIDSAEALIVRLSDDRPRFDRVTSTVPPHHKATGHVRHDPSVRHGGGGGSQDAGESHRIEHLRQFLAAVANRLEPGEDLLILGPGTVRERLARQLAGRARRQGATGVVTCQASPPLTDPQLVARLRRFAGVEPRRRSVRSETSSPDRRP